MFPSWPVVARWSVKRHFYEVLINIGSQVEVPGTRYFFSILRLLSWAENMTSDCIPLIDQGMTPLDESWATPSQESNPPFLQPGNTQMTSWDLSHVAITTAPILNIHDVKEDAVHPLLRCTVRNNFEHRAIQDDFQPPYTVRGCLLPVVPQCIVTAFNKKKGLQNWCSHKLQTINRPTGGTKPSNKASSTAS